jgi:hypothetical protein
MHGAGHRQGAPHAETHHRHRPAARLLQMGHRTADVLKGGTGEIQAVHHVTGLIRVLGHTALEEIRRQRIEAGRSKAIHDTADLGIEPPPLLEDHHTRAVGAGVGEVALAETAIGAGESISPGLGGVINHS